MAPLRGASLALVAAVALASAAAAPTAREPAAFLQRGRWGGSRNGQLPQNTNLQPDFFSEDAQEMVEMPAYKPEVKPPPPDAPVCEPYCAYKCGPHKECDETCEAVCAPPQCETVCMKSADKCDTRCGPPHCAVVCPETHCTGPDCPKCRTVCAPPSCTTQCSDDCHSICAQPTCSWKCHPEMCPKPTCTMQCTGTGGCRAQLPPANATRGQVPILPGSKIVAEGPASLDPAILRTNPTPPPPVGQAMETPSNHSSHGSEATPFARHLGPVAGLKRKWAAEDAREAEQLIFEEHQASLR